MILNIKGYDLRSYNIVFFFFLAVKSCDVPQYQLLATCYNPEGVVNRNIYLLHLLASAPGWTQYSAAENTRACVDRRSILEQVPMS